MSTNYPEQIIVDVEARLHLQHTDRSEEEHYIQSVRGTLISHPNRGDYELTLRPENDVRFSSITSGPCIVLIVLFILDWPKKLESYESEKRERRGLQDPKNFLDLSIGEYSAYVRMNFEDGYAFKRCSMERIGENHYRAIVDTVHRYPSSKSRGLIKILPHDITLTDAGPGHVVGRSEVRWLKEDLSILTGDAEIEVFLKNKFMRIPMTEIYSYEFSHTSFDSYPFVLNAHSKMLAVDNLPIKVHFDEENLIYGDEIVE